MLTSRRLHQAIVQRLVGSSDIRCVNGYIFRRLTAHSSKISSEVANKNKSTNGVADGESSSSMLSRLKSQTYQTAQQSINEFKQKSTANLNQTANTIKESITNAAHSGKERIKNESSRYVSNAQQSMNTLGERVKNSAVSNLKNTKNIVKESISSVAESSKERIRNELSSRTSSPFNNTLPGTDKLISNEVKQSSITRSTSAVNLATKVLAETTTQAATNMTSAVNESVSKATRWLWWWGLAAVGVYGMSTTLTKEGLQILKDAVKSATGDSSVAAGNGGVVASAGTDSNALNENNVDNQRVTRLTSWFSSVKKYVAGNGNADD